MVQIKISKGLDIPIKGEAKGNVQLLGKEISPLHIGLDISSFDDLKFKILIRLDEKVKLGQPILEDKGLQGRYFVSPAGGIIKEIRRGLKRRLITIVIEVDKQEEVEQHPSIKLHEISREELIERLKLGGLFTHIRQRPFNFLANPNQNPRSIFIKALESSPLTPPSELQVAGYEKEFQIGLDALGKLTDGTVNLIYREGTQFRPFLEAKGVEKHSAQGPHPIANPSLHIERIDPIQSVEDVIWTLDAHTVVAIGYFLLHGRILVSRVISIAGPGILEGCSGYFRVREGYPISALEIGRVKEGAMRLISGNPLTGHQVDLDDFLGYEDTVFCVFPENEKREFLHFFRLGGDKYTSSRAYLSGHLNNSHRKYDFTTSQHGERRPFIDCTLYDKVMPIGVPTMPLVKAVLAEDYDLASQLGLLEVDSEDFALPSFVCPSKIDMTDIIKTGLRNFASDFLK